MTSKVQIVQAEPTSGEWVRDPRIRFAVAALLGVEPESFHWPDWLVYGHGGVKGDARRIRIVPSGFFGSQYGQPGSLPTLPIRHSCGVPVLFGHPEVEQWGEELVVANDIIAGAYFMLTRYEELIRSNVRDKHGRFPGTESIAYRAGFLSRPIVDEYAALFRRWLATLCIHLPARPAGIQHVYLTHNVLRPWAWGTLSDSVRAVAEGRIPRDRHAFEPFLGLLNVSENLDPYDCFDWITNQDNGLRDKVGAKRADSVFFLIPNADPTSRPSERPKDKRMLQLIDRIVAKGGRIGLHASGADLEILESERERLEEMTGHAINWNRHNFLKCPEPGGMRGLEDCGVTDDFTIGYADVAGFRVGTCRPYRWFDPVDQKYSNLTIHPLTAMDCTLSRGEYMGLSHEGAYRVCSELIEQASRHGGEAVLLWHNTEVSKSAELDGSYHRRLYSEVLSGLGNARNCIPCR